MVPTPNLNLGFLALPLNFCGIFEFSEKNGGGPTVQHYIVDPLKKVVFF